MVSNSTAEVINYAKTIDAEFNMKLLLIFIFLAYALILFYLDKKYLIPDPRASFKLMSLASKIFYISWFVFLPTFIYQLPITQDMGFMLLYQQYLYVIAATFGILILAIYLLERLFKDWLGWEITLEGLKINVVKFTGGSK